VFGFPVESVEAMAVFLLVFFRLTGVTLSAPLFSNRSFPVRVRVGLALLLSLVMFPVIWSRTTDGLLATVLNNEVGALLTILSEIVAGWTIGFLASLMVFAAQLAGHIIGQEIGFSIGEIFDPVSEGQSAITTQFFFVLALVCFVLLGGPELIVHAINQSFMVLPPGGIVATMGVVPATSFFDVQSIVIDAGGELWKTGVTLALPGMIGLILATAAMAVLARAVPEMNVFILGFTIRIILGLFTLWLILPFIGDVFESYLGVSRQLIDDLLLSWKG